MQIVLYDAYITHSFLEHSNNEVTLHISSQFRKCAYVHFIFFAVLTVQFGSPNYSVLENNGTVTVCLTTNIGSNQSVSVIISTAPKTATGQH